MDVKINQKELIKRAKELVNMIELNETANNLTAKLRAVEGEIEAKEKFAYDMAHWNQIQLGKMLVLASDPNNKLTYDMQETAYTTYSPYRKVRLLIKLNDREILLRLDESISQYKDNPTDILKLKESMYGKILDTIFKTGVTFFIPKQDISANFATSDKASEYDRLMGMQVMRPSNGMRTVYEAFDFPDYNTGKVIDLRKK